MSGEPKGDCPFCDAPKWHVCKHFVGYFRNGQIACQRPGQRGGRQEFRPLGPDDATVETGATIRVYRK